MRRGHWGHARLVRATSQMFATRVSKYSCVLVVRLVVGIARGGRWLLATERRSVVQVAPQGAIRMGLSLVCSECHQLLRAKSGGDIARGS